MSDQDANLNVTRLMRMAPEAEPEGYCIAGCGKLLSSLPRRTKPRTICCGDADCMRTYWVLRRSVVREAVDELLARHLSKAREHVRRASVTLADMEGGSR